jgi:hypothetical protein
MIGLLMMLAAESAIYMPGNELYGLCTGDQLGQMQCMRYIEGVTDGIAVTQISDEQNARAVCVPKAASIEQLTDVTVRLMKDQPDKRHLHASTLVWVALKQAFPCPTKDR